MMSHSLDTSAEVTLDSVYKDIQHWRTHKSDYSDRGIPEATWKKIFQLEAQGYTKTQLRQFFSLNSRQYDMKRAQFLPLKETQSTKQNPTKAPATQNAQKQDEPIISFCEAVESPQPNDEVPSLIKTAAEKTRREISQLRSTNNSPEHFLDQTTIIVECIHPNGHRLKIHTTSQSLDVVMRTFYMQGGLTA